MNAPVPPDEFICPLTKQLMAVPVVSRYGIHFEKKAILEWLNEGNNFCPVTGNPLRPSNLISDPTLQWKIQYVSLKQEKSMPPSESFLFLFFGHALGL